MFHCFLLASCTLLSISVVYAQSSTTCGAGSNCPADLPCCSQYGQCGVGAYCLGGCDPLFSHSLDSCVPAPICKNQDYTFTSLDGITPNTEYLGDSSKSQWVSSGQPVIYQDQVLLTMAENTVGTLLASTEYVWYGNVTATLKTSRGAGVVTAFILLSDVKDEIDWEFVGAALNDGQSNYYYQAIPIYTNEQNITAEDTFGTYHTYGVDWNPDSITWSVDGAPGRTLKRADTWNATDNRYHFPQTPARIELSLWPAGLPSNGEGTIAWAGGLVDWSSPDITNVGYYYAMINSVTVQCYSPPSGAAVSGSNSYIYTGEAGTNNTVEITNDNTILESFLGTGTNMSVSAPASASTVATVPGLSGAGSGLNGQRGGSSASAVSSAGGSASTGGFHGFSQGGTSGATSPVKKDVLLQGSAFAVLVAIVGILAM